MLRLLSALLLVFSAVTADARGGRNTTFDINSEGGNWTCFRTLAACGVGFTQYFNAACDGSTSDSVAQYAWIAYGHARGAALSKLYIPPGSSCVIDPFNASLIADLTVHYVDNGIQNALIWAYGVNFDQMWFGGYAYGNAVVLGNPTTAVINLATTGDTFVTTTTAANASIFPVGSWIAVTALSEQTFGNPSHRFFEYKLVTASDPATGKVTLDSALENTYLTTYPAIGVASSIEQGGPATIYLLEPTWNTNATFKGMRITHVGGYQPEIVGKSIVLQDVQFSYDSNVAPSSSKAIWIINTGIGSWEIDKNVSGLWLINTVGANLMTVQNSSVNMVIQGGQMQAVNGTTANMTVSNFKTPLMRAGPTCCGHGRTLAFDGVTISGTVPGYHACNISAFSFSSGTLTIAKASGSYDCSTRLWVPGMKYYMGDTDGSNTCASGAHTFTVSAVNDAGSNVDIVTDIPSIPVTLTCPNGVRAPSTFGAYQTMTYSAKFSGPGNLLSNPEMLPP